MKKLSLITMMAAVVAAMMLASWGCKKSEDSGITFAEPITTWGMSESALKAAVDPGKYTLYEDITNADATSQLAYQVINDKIARAVWYNFVQASLSSSGMFVVPPSGKSTDISNFLAGRYHATDKISGMPSTCLGVYQYHR